MRTSNFVIVFLVWIPASYGAKIEERCSESQECPASSQCIISKCNSEKTCVCDKNTFPTENKNGCYKVSNRGRYCDELNKCPWGSFCDNSNDRRKCTCLDGFTPSTNFKKCKPIFAGQSETSATHFALYGEECGEKIACVSDRGDVHCEDNTCKCRPGHRPTEPGEINSALYAVGCVRDTVEVSETGSC